MNGWRRSELVRMGFAFTALFALIAVGLGVPVRSTSLAPVWCDPAAFGSVRDFGVGLSPIYVASRDVTSDGRLDLVTANPDNQTVSVLKGNGDGSFQEPISFSTGGRSLWLTVAEINGDGDLDLAVVNSDGGTGAVVLFNGNGDGTFVLSSTITITDPRFITSGDLNTDGRSDLVVVGFNSDSLNILIGNGDGTFQPAETYGLPRLPTSAAIGDVNNDGKLDLLVTNASLSIQGGSGGGVAACGGEGSGGGGGGGPSAVLQPLIVSNTMATNTSIFLGRGDGSFDASPGFGDDGVIATAVLGDFNSDGNLDVAEGTGGEVAILTSLGNGDGTFQQQIRYASGTCPHAVSAGDFNGDGKLDLVTANQGSKNVSLLLGNGDGTFQTPLNFFSGKQPDSIAVGDFDTDGKPDVAATHIDRNNSQINGVAILLNVTVVDDTAPVIGSAAAVPSVLTPANHQMTTVAINYNVSDNCTTSPACNLSVTSNEPISGTGNGDKAPDWEIVDVHHVRLRSERARSGNGRIYTITVACADLVGNATSQTVQVRVP